MQEFKNVHGTQTKVEGIEFNVDTIYIRTNIRREKEVDEITQREMEYWIYDEIQLNVMEFVEMLNSKVEKSNKAQDDLILDNAYRVAVLELSAQGISL